MSFASFVYATFLLFLGTPGGVWCQTYVSFDGASASSAYSKDGFAADQALTTGSGYWCSSGSHSASQVVTWGGTLNARRKAVGVKLNWAYGPGEFKVLSSIDGGNFEEAARWRPASRSDASYEETIMFDGARDLKALIVVMRSPMPWGYFGLNGVKLLASGDESFMMISGGESISGEQCLTASGSELSTAACFDAIASGDGRDVFRFQGQQIAHVASNSCIAVVDGNSNRVGLQDCQAAAQAYDGRSAWELTQRSQLRMPLMGNLCMTAIAGNIIAADCDDAAKSSNSSDTYILTAVPDSDLDAASTAKTAASLLAAAVERQHSALASLQALLPSLSSCTLQAFIANVSSVAKRATRQSGSGSTVMKVASQEDAALIAVRKIYASIGVDMLGAKHLISESSRVLQSAGAQIAEAA